MRGLIPGLIVLFLLGTPLLLYWSANPEPLPELVSANPPQLRVDAKGEVTLVTVRELAAPNLRAFGMEFRFVSAGTGAVVEGGRVFDVRGKILASTDEKGVGRVSNPRLNSLVFGADGYLLEHYFDRPDKVRAMAQQHNQHGYVQIVLEPDALTLPCQLRFTDQSGSLVEGVSFEVVWLGAPTPTSVTIPKIYAGSGFIRPELRSAWRRHVLLSTMRSPDFNPEMLHFGAQSANETYSCQGVADIRLVAEGSYRIEARSEGLVAQQVIDVQGPSPEPIAIELRPGVHVGGRVLSAEGSNSVAGAIVVVSRDGRILASGESGSSGEFQLGPMDPNQITLKVRHPRYAPFEKAGLYPGPGTVDVALQPLPKHTVRGLVQLRPLGKGIQGARVQLTSGLGVASETVTDAQGRFEIASTLMEPTVEVFAKGYLDYAEMLNANGEPVRIGLIPDQPRARQQAGLSSLITGRVEDSKRQPVPNCPVHIQPHTPASVTGVPGRRIIRGAAIPIATMGVTDADGVYLIEWPRSEGLSLTAGRVGPGATPRRLSVVLGRVYQLDLRSR